MDDHDVVCSSDRHTAPYGCGCLRRARERAAMAEADRDPLVAAIETAIAYLGTEGWMKHTPAIRAAVGVLRDV
jgi:hypothetical protein